MFTVAFNCKINYEYFTEPGVVYRPSVNGRCRGGGWIITMVYLV